MQAVKITWWLVRTAIFLLLLFTLFRWVDFSVGQSVTLTLMVVIGCVAYLSIKNKTALNDSFSPYRVGILPKFKELLTDYKLLKDDDSRGTPYLLGERGSALNSIYDSEISGKREAARLLRNRPVL